MFAYLLETPWANLFCLQYVLRPEQEELETSHQNGPYYVFQVSWQTLLDGRSRQSNFAILDFTRKVALIEYWLYWVKKGNFLCIKFHIACNKNAPMHCSANVG
jgi:phosphoenolpyruvate carboxykinase (ATP)